MHIDMAQEGGGKVFFWNVDAPVGLSGANNFDDVMFVQWCLYKIAQWPARSQRLRDGLSKVNISGECSGAPDDPLVASLKFFQGELGVKQDGRVSPARGSGGKYNRGGVKYPYLVFHLNAVLRELHPDQYPRLDKMPEFIWRIKDKVTTPFI